MPAVRDLTDPVRQKDLSPFRRVHDPSPTNFNTISQVHYKVGTIKKWSIDITQREGGNSCAGIEIETSFSKDAN